MVKKTENEVTAIATTEASSLDTLYQVAQEMVTEAQGYNPEPVILGIIHAAALFEIPGQEAPVKELEGVILASRMERSFFPPKNADEAVILEITNRRPICGSRDYVHGVINENAAKTDNNALVAIIDQIKECSMLCSKCPMNAWGSVELFGINGRGKVCKEKRRLLYWTLGATIPMILTVPTSSIKAWDGYCSSLQMAGKPHSIVNTGITLKLIEIPGQKYSVMEFARKGDMTEEQAKELITPLSMKGQPTILFRGLVDLFSGTVVDEVEEVTDDF